MAGRNDDEAGLLCHRVRADRTGVDVLEAAELVASREPLTGAPVLVD